jgi:NAD(P)-dependent dehydrogenase (short-subunit alcohol dehydrogenase family)
MLTGEDYSPIFIHRKRLCRAFDINFFSVLTLVQLALPSLRENKGRIILVGSGAATYTVNGWGAYCS